jgi:hypothetical protein
MGKDIFYGVTSTKPVTVKVPSGATGYGPIPCSYTTDTTTNWGNGFRGGGWDGTTFTFTGSASDINPYIELNIITYP